ncbi:MAG: ABC transporter permease [Pseudomonadota bacterium]
MSPHTSLFWLWLKRDIKSRYAGSFIGLLWAILGPLLTIAMFYVLFAHIFKVRIPELASDTGFLYHLLAGMLPWLAIAEGLSRSTGVLVAHEQFLQKQAFPIGVLPATTVMAALLPQLIGSLLFIALLIGAGLFHPDALIALPFLLAAQIAMTLGLGMALSIFAVHLRDLMHAVPISMQFLLYATPILYPLSMVPAEYHHLYLLNPFACLTLAYQAAFLQTPIEGVFLLGLAAWSIVLGAGGYTLFRLLKPTVGEVL